MSASCERWGHPTVGRSSRPARVRRARGDAPAGPAPQGGARPRLRRRAADPAAAARPGRRQVRRVRRRHALHRRRARAGVQAGGRGDPRRAVLQRLAGDGARPRLRHRLGCRGHVGARRHRPRASTSTPSPRRSPTSTCGRGRTRGPGSGWPRSSRHPATRCARGSGVWLDPARRVPGATGRHGRIKRVFRLDEIQPTWEFVLQVATAGARHRGQALAVDAARRHPARHRGPVDVVRRRGARVRGVVGAAGPAAGAQRPHPRAQPLADRGRRDDGRAGDPDRRVARRRRAVALRAGPRGDPGRPAGGRHRRDARQRGRHRARLRRERGEASTCRSPGATPCAR